MCNKIKLNKKTSKLEIKTIMREIKQDISCKSVSIKCQNFETHLRLITLELQTDCVINTNI